MGRRFWLIFVSVCIVAYDSIAYNYSGGTGTPEDPYLISTPQDWQMLCSSPNDVNSNKCFVLTNDLNLSGYAVSEVGTVLEPFMGSFDGCGHTIYGLVIPASTNYFSGLFGKIGAGGYVHDLSVYAPSITADSGSGICMGGFAGYNEGTIRRCSVTGGTYNLGYTFDVAGFVGGNNGLITDSSFTGDISVGANNYTIYEAAGFVSCNWGTIAFCTVQGNVTVIAPSGGLLVGSNWGGIYNCSATGSVSTSFYNCDTTCGGLVGDNASIIDSSYANVSAHGYGTYELDTRVGGLVGINWRGAIIRNCYATGEAKAHLALFGTSVSKVGGLVSLSDLGIIHCYSAGKVSSSPSSRATLGGLVAELYDAGTIGDSFWDVNTSGRSWSAGGTGKTTAEMKTLSTFIFSGWDFTNESVNDTNDNWRMCTSGVDYPRLNWESITGDFMCPDGVNVEDLDYFVQRWLLGSCALPNNCGGADIDGSGVVEFTDFAIFVQHWLEGI